MHLLMKIKMALKISSVNSLEAEMFVHLFVLYLHLYHRRIVCERDVRGGGIRGLCLKEQICSYLTRK